MQGFKTPGPKNKFFAYYDTAQWVGKLVSEAHPTEPVVVYTGVGKSGVILAGERRTVDREGIKAGPWAGGNGRKKRCSYLGMTTVVLSCVTYQVRRLSAPRNRASILFILNVL